MARSGILYSDVVRAVSLLVNQDKSITVDNVREAMGGTGSKSTIAPMLKRWKLEHQEVIEAATSGLPASLVQAVKGVYEQLQADAAEKVELAQQRYQRELDETHQQEQQLTDEKLLLIQKTQALAAELKEAQQTILKLRHEKQAMQVSLATLEGDKSGLQLRLVDRTAEVSALNQQLTLARDQFDHYQEATAAQRTEERQSYEQRIARQESDSAATQQRLLSLQSRCSQLETQVVHLTAANQRLQMEADTMGPAMNSLRTERDVLSHQYKSLQDLNLTATTSLDNSQQTLAICKTALAVAEAQTAALMERLADTEGKLNKLDQERLILVQERAELLAQASDDRKMLKS